MDWIWQDLRYGFRSLRNQPGFTALAVLALALGIGAATTIFSVIQNVLLDPFPYTDAERVVAIQIRDLSRSRPGGRTAFQTPEFLDYQEQAHVFEGVIGGTFEDMLYTTKEGTEQFDGGLVTGNMFRFLGVPALMGRTLTEEDARPGAPPVFVMSYKMWTKRFNQDPKILGRNFVFNGVSSTLVGIMPQRFTKLGADLWKPVTMDRADPVASRRYYMFQARLKPGVTMQQAEAEVGVIAQRLAKVYPDNYPKKFGVKVVSWVDSLVGQFRKTLYTLAAAVCLLLLIACVNVANMLLARATAREKEMAIRSSLGASRARLVWQLLIESFLLALAGTAVGCLFAYFGIKALVTAIPLGLIPQEAVIRLNPQVLLFSLGVSVVTAVLFGLAPALQTARRDLVEPLKDTSKGVTGGFRRGRLRNALVVLEVALSLVLLAGAGPADAQLRQAADGGPGLQSQQYPGGPPTAAAGAVQDRGVEAPVLPPVAAAAEGAAGGRGGDGNDDVAALRRHSQRNRHPRQDPLREVGHHLPVVQRRVLSHAGFAAGARAAAFGGGSERRPAGGGDQPDLGEPVLRFGRPHRAAHSASRCWKRFQKAKWRTRSSRWWGLWRTRGTRAFRTPSCRRRSCRTASRARSSAASWCGRRSSR